jgi:hypothetical protein
MPFVFGIRNIGEKWRCMDESKFEIFKQNCIKHKTPAYMTVYSFKTPERIYPIFDKLFLDFDSSDGSNVDGAIAEAVSIAKSLSVFLDKDSFKDISIFESGGKGAHIVINFLPVVCTDKFDVGVINSLCERFFSYIIDNFKPVFLCESCRTPAAKLRRLPGSFHEKSGKECRVIDVFSVTGSFDLLDCLISDYCDGLGKLSYRPPVSVSSGEYLLDYNSADLRDVWRFIRPELIFKTKSDGDLMVQHPDQFSENSGHSGIVNQNMSYCFITNESFNFHNTVLLLCGGDKNLLVEKLSEYKG